MRHTGLLIALLVLSAGTQAAVPWAPTSAEALVQGAGDPRTPDGASLALSAEAVGPDGFVGAITSLDASAFRGSEVELSASLEVTQGKGAAAIWLRADGPDGRLAFLATGHRPVVRGDGAQMRMLRLYIPSAATQLKLGATLQSAGALRANAMTLKTLEAAPETVSAYTLLDSAISTIRAHALQAARVDWSAQALLLTPELHDQPPQDAHAAIRTVLEALGDRHSTLLPAQAANDYRSEAVPTQSVEAHARDGVGYVRVPGLRGSDRAAGRAFSASLCEAIVTHAASASAGWIVDLRSNGGGNMWPMLVGLRPLLGDVDIGAFKDRAGATRAWTPDRLDTCRPDLASARVAVLIDPATASSGEAVAVAFRGRAGTRFFGQPTAGLATSNRNFPLADGSLLLLTTAVFVDRAGTVYPEGVAPDVPVDAAQDARRIAEDWLRSQHR